LDIECGKVLYAPTLVNMKVLIFDEVQESGVPFNKRSLDFVIDFHVISQLDNKEVIHMMVEQNPT